MDGVTGLGLQIATGIGLSACAGLRAFLPLFATGLAARLGWVPLGPSFEWLSSTPALVIFGVAVVTEILGDKIPVVDHALDIVQTIVKPAAGTVLMASMITHLSPLQATILGLVAGGTTSGLVHLAKAKLRFVSTIVTAGLGNPFLSVAEDLVTLAGWVLSVVLPILMVVIVAASIATAFIMIRTLRARPGPRAFSL